MKIISYNVNGIRSALSKGLVDFVQSANADVICLQETKAMESQVESYLFDVAGYHHRYWLSAEKKGYSGVALFCKNKPDHVAFGFNDPAYDIEGRIIRADFGSTSVISVYIPSGSSGETRQAFKMVWLEYFFNYINNLKASRPNLIICGDYNICHQPIDIHDPKSNKDSSGFLPDERAWLTRFIESGFTDSFRMHNTGPHNYSWWSYRANARNNNKGWRIDYCMVSNTMRSQIKAAGILPHAKHSDHCPVWVELLTDEVTLHTNLPGIV
ncbi:MAG: exodeoxyribonuclease III [Bacteroidia bacterium]|nr:exodeoxyribonuclease III [Bacteroidia bacterium]